MKQEKNKSRILAFAATLVVSSGIGCTPQITPSKTGVTAVQAGDPSLSRSVGSYVILGQKAFRSKVATGEITATSSTQSEKFFDSLIASRRSGPRQPSQPAPATPDSSPVTTPDSSLIVGIPADLLKKPLVFGSVITQVSDQNNEDLGDLKLADIPAFQVMLVAQKAPDNTPMVSVVDCGVDCSKMAAPSSLMDIPVTGMDSQKKLIYLDLAALGSGLDLTAIRKGDPSLAKFKSKTSQTVRFEYSNASEVLIFDVETHMIASTADPSDATASETVLTNRWFFQPEAPFNPAFVSRKAAPGVGFFMTEKSTDPLVQRWDFDLRGEKDGIKYYIKHVPAEYQAAFAGSFDEWNTKLLPVIGKKIFTYEFIPEGDPRNEQYVTGDVRYNVMEWDLVNKASYGGLGPSLANQYTGEVFHANVLVQGPTIVELYTKWFNAHQTAASLRAEGRTAEAANILNKTKQELKTRVANLTSRSFQMKLGNNLNVRIRSREPALEDPLLAKDGFDPVPAGFTYDAYMAGYFHDMVTHELGHNLGLRHNFRGSLGALDGPLTTGSVSRSVMEYLGRGYRQYDHVGEYDLMALQYGYAGILPTHTDWYCTDEDAADLNDPTKSAECTSNDATNDPFSFYQAELSRAEDLLLARGQTAVPDWTVADMTDQLKLAFVGLGSYAGSAEKTSAGWTNFFNKADRPTQAADVKGYVLSKLKLALCDTSLDKEAGTKASPDGKTKALANLADLRAKAVEILKPIFSADDLKCQALNGLM